MADVRPSEVRPSSLRGDATHLTIVWSDGLSAALSWEFLRKHCPCAVCRVEREKPPAPTPLFAILKPGEAAPIRGTAMEPLGNYAYQIRFSDGHGSGIYSFEYLRELSGQAGIKE